MSLGSSVLTNGYQAIARYRFWINLGVAFIHQSPIFDSGSGLIINLSLPTPVGLVWREFGVLSLDQWVLGNGQVSILDQFRCGFDAPESNLWLWDW